MRTEAERLGNVAKVTVTRKVVEKLAWAPGTMPAFYCTGQSLLQGGMHPAASPASITVTAQARVELGRR